MADGNILEIYVGDPKRDIDEVIFNGQRYEIKMKKVSRIVLTCSPGDLPALTIDYLAPKMQAEIGNE